MSRLRSFFTLMAALVLAGAVLGLAACGGSDGDSDEVTPSGNGETTGEASVGKAAFIGVAPVTQGNWDPAGYQAFIAMAEKYGLEASNQESVGYDEATAVIRRLAQENDLVIAHSSGYEASVLEVAAEFPDTWFVVWSDLSSTNDLPNVAGWAANWNEFGYLAGTAGCIAAKTENKPNVGHVNSEPIPAFSRLAAGVRDGAKASGCDFQTVWTNSFDDVAKASQAAKSMIGRGAGAITTSADTADEGTRQGATDGGAFFVGNYTPGEVELSPNTVTSIVLDYDGTYDEIGRLFTEGELEPKIYPMNVENGGIAYGPFTNVDDKIASEAEAVLEQIRNGEIKVDDTAEIKP